MRCKKLVSKYVILVTSSFQLQENTYIGIKVIPKHASK